MSLKTLFLLATVALAGLPWLPTASATHCGIYPQGHAREACELYEGPWHTVTGTVLPAVEGAADRVLAYPGPLLAWEASVYAWVDCYVIRHQVIPPCPFPSTPPLP